MEGNQSLTSIITDLYRTFFDVIGNLSSLVKAEIQQAKGTLVKSVLLLCTALILTSFTWLGICTAICVLLVKYEIGLLTSILIVTGINAILMMLTISYVSGIGNRTLFSGSKRQLERLTNNHGKDGKYE